MSLRPSLLIIILLYPILRNLQSREEPTHQLLRIKNDITSWARLLSMLSLIHFVLQLQL